MVEKTCVSCNKATQEYINFKCPECGEEIIRCQHCRALGIEYKCPNKECRFVAP
jgi:predicted RNA-binding Zn-ribbon protein involved in translation (DUF1610 family)